MRAAEQPLVAAHAQIGVAMALRCQQTLQQALRAVSDALVGVRKLRVFREQQELLVKALANASQIATLRY